jgi:predicted nucleotidyltransferase
MTKTALDLTTQEWQAYQPAKAVEKYRGQTRPQRKQEAWQLVHQAANLLKNQFKAKKVVLFGSLAHESWFNDWSDIDLAAWGIPFDCFYRAVAAATDLSADFRIDLVDPETCRPSLRVAIEQHGIEL